MAEEQKDVENKAAESAAPTTTENATPKKEQKPVNFKNKYIALGVLGVVRVVAIVLCIVFLV